MLVTGGRMELLSPEGQVQRQPTSSMLPPSAPIQRLCRPTPLIFPLYTDSCPSAEITAERQIQSQE